MKVGRKIDPDGNLALARELGITRQRVIRMGGAARLRAMSPEALAIMLGRQSAPPKKLVSMRALGMASRVPGNSRDEVA